MKILKESRHLQVLSYYFLYSAFQWHLPGEAVKTPRLCSGAFAAAVLVPIVAYVFWMAYRIWGNKKPREDENRMIENIILMWEMC